MTINLYLDIKKYNKISTWENENGWVGTRNRKKCEPGHVTLRCPGNAFNTDAFDQSEAPRVQSAANQLVASEDLK